MKVTHFLLPVILLLFSACNNGKEKNGSDDNYTDTSKIIQESSANQESQTPAALPYNKEVSYESIKFSVSSPGIAAGNNFTLTPGGLTIENNPITMSIEGLVSDVIIDDIDADNSPEVGIITKMGNVGKAYIFSANGNKSLSAVNFPDPTDAKLLAGYKGEDEFNFVEGSFVRRFPVFEGEIKTGKFRQLQYRLRPGEAMKQLVLKRYDEY